MIAPPNDALDHRLQVGLDLLEAIPARSAPTSLGETDVLEKIECRFAKGTFVTLP